MSRSSGPRACGDADGCDASSYRRCSRSTRSHALFPLTGFARATTRPGSWTQYGENRGSGTG